MKLKRSHSDTSIHAPYKHRVDMGPVLKAFVLELGYLVSVPALL